MKLSEETLDILKNFSTINENLFIEKNTNIIRTMSESQNIFAEVEVEETFPVDIGILNLHKFLQTISMFDVPILSFDDTFMIIKEEKGRSKFKYFFTDPSCLTYPKGSIREFPTPVSFTLNEDTLGQIKKMSSITSLPHVKISYDSSVVKLEVMDRTSDTSNVFSLEVDGTGDEKIEAFMKVENLKLFPDDYNMKLSNSAARIRNLSPLRQTLEYCISMDLTNVA